MFNWLKNKLAGDELRRKDETIQRYRDMIQEYEVRYDEFIKAKLKAEILEMHIEQGISLDDAIKAAVDKKIASHQSALYNQLSAQQNMNHYGQNSMRGLGGIFGPAFFQ